MSATAAASTLGHLIAARKISLPREPPPIKPKRIRSFAPRTRLSATVPALAIATPAALPDHRTQEDPSVGHGWTPLYDLDQLGPTEKDFTLRIRRYDSFVISTEPKAASK